MSAAVYSRLLDEFRQRWHESSRKLWTIDIRSPGSFVGGTLADPRERTVDYDSEQIIGHASLLRTDKSRVEETCEAVAVVQKVTDGRAYMPSTELIERLTQLFSEAGATLPLSIRKRLPVISWTTKDPASRWITLLAYSRGFTVYSDAGVYQEHQFITNPWEASIDAIEYLGLNTDSACWPDAQAAEKHSQTEVEFAVGKLWRAIAHSADHGSAYAAKIEAWEKRHFSDSNFPSSTAPRLIRHLSDLKGWTPNAIAEHEPADLAVLLEAEYASKLSEAIPDDKAAGDAEGGGTYDEAGDNPRPAATVNERMKAELAANLETVKGWTARQWATHLGCSVSSVGEAPTWKDLEMLRKKSKAEKAMDRHRKSRPGKR